MFFSGKVTHSIIQFLSLNGKCREEISEMTSLPLELLTDPMGWLNAHEVEEFLMQVEKCCCVEYPGKNFLQEVGHQALDLKAWGVLDSVLRIMPTPQDIFNQPERFISYFVSPPPPIANLQQTEDWITFDLPISSEEFPCVTTFLKSAFEVLPKFMGHEMAEVSWVGPTLSVSWKTSQESLFASDVDRRTLPPEFMQSIVATLENTEKELEVKRRELSEREREIATIRSENERAAASLLQHPPGLLTRGEIQNVEKPLSEVRQTLLKLSDYMARSQQLITLLVGQNRMSSQVKEAMKRVNWDGIMDQYPSVVSEGVSSIEEMQERLKHWNEQCVTPKKENQTYIQGDLVDWANPSDLI